MSLRAVAVDYANTIPLRSGLESLEAEGSLSMALARPARATELFSRGQYQLGLLPAAAHLGLPKARFVGNYGIVADGFVGSVGIFCERPLEELTEIYLDYDSRSSVILARILLAEHWQLTGRSSSSLKISPAKPGYREQLGGTVGGVIIGDPAIEARQQFAYYYDLAEAWKEMTGLPFVFAAWLSSVRLSQDFIARFDAAQQSGVARRAALAREYQAFIPGYDLHTYFTRQIHYEITGAAREGLAEFLRLGAEMLGIEREHKLVFT